MGHGSYTWSPCEICGKSVSNNGWAYKSHMRMHVRKGEAREIYHGKDKNGTFTRFEVIKPDKP